MNLRLVTIVGLSAVTLSACTVDPGPASPVRDPNLGAPVQVGVVQPGAAIQPGTPGFDNSGMPLTETQFQPNLPPAPKPKPVSNNDLSSMPNTEARDTLVEQKQQSEALSSLYDKAVSAVSAGNYGQAASSLEQALRIEPSNGSTWHDLGGVRMRQKQYDQAISMAQKSIGLAGGNDSLKARNWRLIAAALRAKGDTAGAQEAQAKAAAFQ